MPARGGLCIPDLAPALMVALRLVNFRSVSVTAKSSRGTSGDWALMTPSRPSVSLTNSTKSARIESCPSCSPVWICRTS